MAGYKINLPFKTESKCKTLKESADYGIIIELDRLRNAVYALMLIYGACRDGSLDVKER